MHFFLPTRRPSAGWLALPLLLSCMSKETEPPTTTPIDTVPTGEGIFARRCPVEGQATAQRLEEGEVLPGKRAVGTEGDLVLFNERAAFVITRPDAESTYWYYGGALVDAVAVADCSPVHDDKLEELGIVVGRLQLPDIDTAVLRGFEATEVEVLQDGGDGGPAIVRATGVDAPHWLVEYTLQREASSDRTFLQALHQELTVDYILEPDSPLLRIELTILNPTEEPQRLLSAALFTFGDTLDTHRFALSRIGVAGFSFGGGVPWLVATDGDGAYAYAVDGLNLGSLTVSGVDVITNLDQAVTLPLEPGANGGTATQVAWFSVGATDGSSATEPLHAVHPEPVRGDSYELHPLDGQVVDETTDQGLTGLTVLIEAQDRSGNWGVLDSVSTKADGRFSGHVPAFETGIPLRLSVSDDGRHARAAVDVDPTSATGLQLALGAAGVVRHVITDGTQPIPARIEFVGTEGGTARRFVLGEGTVPLPPGTWDYTVTRGWEHAPATGTIEVPEGGEVTLTAELPRVLDTSGFLSADTHIHSEASADSRVLQTQQLLVGSAHGLEVAVATDHEAVVDFAPAAIEAGLDHLIATVPGEEVTASVPEHMTMFPTPPDGTPRGGPIRWYQLDVRQLIAAQRDRGADVVIMNHPGYLDEIGWDRVAGAPTLEDPERLGLAADAALWDWSLDGVEIMTSGSNPFVNGNRRWENWQSFLNHGHLITAVGASDDHSGNETGIPSTYFLSSTDDPAQFDIEEMTDAYLEGRALISLGAFARFSIQDAQLGDTITLADGIVDVQVQVQALPEVDISDVYIFANCDEVARIAADQPSGLIKLDTEVRLTLERDAHLSVVAFGRGDVPRGLLTAGLQTPRVVTNSIYVDVDGNGVFDAPGGKSCSYTLPQ